MKREESLPANTQKGMRSSTVLTQLESASRFPASETHHNKLTGNGGTGSILTREASTER